MACKRKTKLLSHYYHLLLRDMSKRTSEDLSNTIKIPDPNNLEGGDGEEDVFEGSELDSAADRNSSG